MSISTAPSESSSTPLSHSLSEGYGTDTGRMIVVSKNTVVIGIEALPSQSCYSLACGSLFCLAETPFGNLTLGVSSVANPWVSVF